MNGGCAGWSREPRSTSSRALLGLDGSETRPYTGFGWPAIRKWETLDREQYSGFVPGGIETFPERLIAAPREPDHAALLLLDVALIPQVGNDRSRR